MADIIASFPKKAQPQRIEDPKDGFPRRNGRFWGYYDEIIAVALGVKPVCITCYSCVNMKEEDDEHYTIEQVSEVLKHVSVPLYYVSYMGDDDDENRSFIVFKDDTRDLAITMFYLDEVTNGVKRDVIRGILLGYAKEEDIFICAWFMIASLQEIFSVKDFDKKRGRVIKKEGAAAVRDVYKKQLYTWDARRCFRS
jgi:hypothetical protein